MKRKKLPPLELAIQNLKQGLYIEAESLARNILAFQKNNYKALLILGKSLQLQKKLDEALQAFKTADLLKKNDPNILINIGETLQLLNKTPEASVYFEKITEINLLNLNLISRTIDFYRKTHNNKHALELITKYLKHAPQNIALLSLKAKILQDSNMIHESILTLKQIAEIQPSITSLAELATAYYKWLGNAKLARHYYIEAYKKDPNNISLLTQMCTFFHEVKVGSEKENLSFSYELAKKIASIAPQTPSIAGTIQSVAINMLDYDLYNKFAPRLREWVGAERLSRVKTLQDRLFLIEDHKKAGQIYEQLATKNSINKPIRRKLNNKIRIGLLSSDLRRHSVGYFMWPIIDYINKNNFEIYIYSGYPGEIDDLQKEYMQKSDLFKDCYKDHPKSIAQNIANDHVDILLELSGWTAHNKLLSCAYRPAPIQISWLGYVHPIGMKASLDYIMLDPYILPKNPNLLIEKPLKLPNTWVSLDSKTFGNFTPPNKSAEEKNGYLTFGCFNASYKITPKVIELWAKIMKLVPNSKFLYMRPESVSPDLRNNFIKHMEKQGIPNERIQFISVRENYRNYYNYVDIALDTFPHTGGTVTCESLWRGIPVVTLVGESFFERLGYSNLSNAGLSKLCAFTEEDYINIAVDLAKDKVFRQHLAKNLHNQIKDLPLGQTYQFAKDFENLIYSLN